MEEEFLDNYILAAPAAAAGPGTRTLPGAGKMPDIGLAGLVAGGGPQL